MCLKTPDKLWMMSCCQSMLNNELATYLLSLDANIEPIDEIAIGNKITEIVQKNGLVKEKEELAELYAFHLVPRDFDQAKNRASYYGPMFVSKNDENNIIEFPDIKRIDGDMLSYWRKRAEEAKHPVLVARYTDLVINFEPEINGSGKNYKYVRKLVDSTILICNQGLNDSLACKAKLKRSLDLVRGINDIEGLQIIKKGIIETEKRLAVDDKPGLWGQAFKWLVLDDTNKALLSLEEKDLLVRDLEERLERLISVDDPNPWLVENVVQLLVDYYAGIQDEKALEPVLGKLEEAFHRNKHANSDGLLVMNYLERLVSIYTRYSKFTFAKRARDRVFAELSNLGGKVPFATNEISVEVPIKKESIEDFLASTFGKDGLDPLEKVVTRVAVNFVPRKDATSKQLKDISKKYIFRYFASNIITSEDGYPIAKFSSIEEDYDQHLAEHFSQVLHFESFFLQMVVKEIKKKYTVDNLYPILKESPVFRSEDRDYILRLLKAFWDDDFLLCNCLMVPLIEDAFRNLYRINGAPFIKDNKENGYDAVSLHNLLDQGLVKETYQELGEGMEYYFKILLTSRIGWNLRNNFAHGMNKKAFFAENVANRLFHVLLCLSLIRKVEPTS